MTEYLVIRSHWGEKEYKEGETRTARPADVAHLIGRCLVEKEEAKAEKPLKNKAAKKVRNKSAE